MLNEYINLEIKHFSGTLQPGLLIYLILQLEGPQGIIYISINFMSIIFKTGISFNSSVLKFGQDISSHTVNLNASQLIIAFNITTETFNFTGKLISQQASFVHMTLNPIEVNVHYIPNIVSPPTTRTSTNTQPFSVITVSSVTTTSSITSFSLFPVIGGVVGAIVLITIVVIVIGFIGVYFYGIHKGKQMSVNNNHLEMTTLSSQPSILTEYENLPVITPSSTEQTDKNKQKKISQIPPAMAEFSTTSKNTLENNRYCDVIYSLPQRSSNAFIPSSTSAEYTTLCASTLEKDGVYSKVLRVFPNP